MPRLDFCLEVRVIPDLVGDARSAARSKAALPPARDRVGAAGLDVELQLGMLPPVQIHAEKAGLPGAIEIGQDAGLDVLIDSSRSRLRKSRRMSASLASGHARLRLAADLLAGLVGKDQKSARRTIPARTPVP